MQMVRISCESGDWEQFYFDEMLLDEGHSVDTVELLRQLGFSVRCIEVTDAYMEDNCRVVGFMEPPREFVTDDTMYEATNG